MTNISITKCYRSKSSLISLIVLSSVISSRSCLSRLSLITLTILFSLTAIANLSLSILLYTCLISLALPLVVILVTTRGCLILSRLSLISSTEVIELSFSTSIVVIIRCTLIMFNIRISIIRPCS